MKLFSESPGASMSMAASEELRSLLRDILKEGTVTHVLETGTFRGLGSTMFVSESFPVDHPPRIFVTIEANWVSWRQAKGNLRRFPFVKALWGRTVPVRKALAFIERDEALRNHREYPDIYIDDVANPVYFYSQEVAGRLRGSADVPKNLVRRYFDRLVSYAGENLLEKYATKFRSTNPLIILDSAGGIGFLEFTIVEAAMRKFPYLLLLDDINHIKHFRSYRHVREDPHFELLGADQKEGWLLARHRP